ncbi:MAG: PAS domain-containing protein [Ramlibacter sp.]|nr:PAS domain-containing protein [Ramlibacter sp.]
MYPDPASPRDPSSLDEHRADTLDLLRDSDAHLQAAISVAHLGTFELIVRSGEVMLDQRAREILGFGAGEGLTAEAVYARMHPDDAAWVLPLVERAVAQGDRVDVEYRLRLPDGSTRYVVSGGKMIAGEDGPTQKLSGVLIDVTQRKEVERALRESEAKFKTIANAMPQMVWSTLPDGCHDYYNQQWYDFTGTPPGSTDGEKWNGIFHPQDQAHAGSVWRHSLRTGEPYEIQYRLRHHSGEYRWVLGRALPVRNDAGEIIRWMGTCTDIHEQRVAQDELMAANRRKDEFLAMLAHELRNPLAPISTAAQLLKLSPGDPARIARAGEIIARQVRHMTTLVDDLLDVSRVTRGRVQLRRDEVELHTVLQNAVEQVRPLFEERGHELVTDIAPVAANVVGDRTRLIQIVSNLLNNAAKYTPRNGRVTLSMRLDAGRCEISVMDNGIGMESELLPHVFDLFTQGHRTPDRSQGGLGLGLSLVKSLAELHGGSVRCSSEGNGRGSSFTVVLPLAAQSRPDISTPPQTDRMEVEAKRMSVLVVDDNVDAGESLAALLESEGHMVRLATDAHEALDEAGARPPEVFILDIGLPDIDGYELAKRLKALPGTQDATFVALTGYGHEQDRMRSRSAGFHHHCVKPVDFGALAAILEEAGSGCDPMSRRLAPPRRTR